MDLPVETTCASSLITWQKQRFKNLETLASLRMQTGINIVRYSSKQLAPRLLREREVHVYVRRVSDFSGSEIDKFWGALSPDEMHRAIRFRFEQDRTRYIVTRAQLRALLGAYLKSHPSSLQFSYSLNGKPELSCPGREPTLRFNVTHSGDVILLAFTWRRRVGVDVERVQLGLLGEDIAERFFSASECQGLRALPPSQRQQAFFRCWTRKEAYVKASGSGLAFPLDSFDVSFGADEPARLLATRPDAAEASRWFMKDLEIEQGYVAALVIEGKTSSWNPAQGERTEIMV